MRTACVGWARRGPASRDQQGGGRPTPATGLLSVPPAAAPARHVPVRQRAARSAASQARFGHLFKG